MTSASISGEQQTISGEYNLPSDIRSAGCAAIRIRKRCPNGQHELARSFAELDLNF
jgi:hypothetical protein